MSLLQEKKSANPVINVRTMLLLKNNQFLLINHNSEFSLAVLCYSNHIQYLEETLNPIKANQQHFSRKLYRWCDVELQQSASQQQLKMICATSL